MASHHLAGLDHITLDSARPRPSLFYRPECGRLELLRGVDTEAESLPVAGCLSLLRHPASLLGRVVCVAVSSNFSANCKGSFSC